MEDKKSGITVKKPSKLKKFKNTFIATDAKDIGGDLFSRIVIPGIKKLFSDMIKKATDLLFYGKDGNPDDRRSSSSYFGYGGIYSSGNSYTNNSQQTYRRSSVIDLYDIVLEDERDANDILHAMIDVLTSPIGKVSVADYYDFVKSIMAKKDVAVDIRILSMDNEYGWTDLSSARVVYNGNGYRLDLPPVRELR